MPDVSALSRLVNLLRRHSLDREFDEELRFHIDARIEHNLGLGMNRRDAEADAGARFGDIDRVKGGMRAARIIAGVSRSRHPRATVALAGAAFLAAATLFTYRWSVTPDASLYPVYEVSDGVVAPVPLRTSTADYTTAARLAKVQGVVRVRCIVRPSGDCTDVAVVRSPDPAFGLDGEAVRAVQRWRFRPGSLDGQPVATRVHLEFTFALR
jgi:TonB family protein